MIASYLQTLKERPLLATACILAVTGIMMTFISYMQGSRADVEVIKTLVVIITIAILVDILSRIVSALDY